MDIEFKRALSQLQMARGRIRMTEADRAMNTLNKLAPYMEALSSDAGDLIFRATCTDFDYLLGKQLTGEISDREIAMLAAYRQILSRWDDIVRRFFQAGETLKDAAEKVKQ